MSCSHDRIFQWWVAGRETSIAYQMAETAGLLANKKAEEAQIATKDKLSDLPEKVNSVVTGILFLRKYSH